MATPAGIQKVRYDIPGPSMLDNITMLANAALQGYNKRKEKDEEKKQPRLDFLGCFESA